MPPKPKPDVLLSEVEAALLVDMSPPLLRWFTSHAPKSGHDRKLPFEKKGVVYFYWKSHLLAFDQYLREPWPVSSGTRPNVPSGIVDEIKSEAHYQCAFCPHGSHGEAAHIKPVKTSFNNHPHNLIWACRNHHAQYDFGFEASDLKPKDVVAAKNRLREERRRILANENLVHGGLLATFTQIEEMQAALRAAKPGKTSVEKLAALKSGVNAALATFEARLQKPAPSEVVLASRIVSKVATKSELFDTAKSEVQAFVAEEGLVPCKLCDGSGRFRDYDRCPICDGSAFVTKDERADADTSRYDLLRCTLCKGSGQLEGDTCPGCDGAGQMERWHAETFDVSQYRLVPCPVCRGTGHRFDGDCALCSGEGKIAQRVLAQVNLSDYLAVPCPRCDGAGVDGYGDGCRNCNGRGEHRRADAMTAVGDLPSRL